MQPSQVILSPIPVQPYIIYRNKRKTFIRLFSLFVFITILISVWQSYSHFSAIVGDQSLWKIKGENLLNALQYDNGINAEEVVLKYKVYKVPLAAYTEPNLILSLCMLISFPFVIHSIQKQTATPIAFFQFNLSSIYLQILILGLDLSRYLLLGLCLGIRTGGFVVWLHLLTKVTYYNSKTIKQQPVRFCITVIVFLAGFVMIILKGRIDLVIAVLVALLDIAFIQGGTVKYPKEVFQEKQNWAAIVEVDRWPLWENFIWNQYTVNEQLCVDSVQFYVTRKERMLMIS